MGGWALGGTAQRWSSGPLPCCLLLNWRERGHGLVAVLLLCQVLPGLNADGAPCRLTGPAGSLRSGRRCCLSLYCRDVSGTTAVWASCGPEQKTRASCLPGSFPSLPAPPARLSTALASPLHSSCPQIARACLSSWEPWPEWGASRITRGDEGSWSQAVLAPLGTQLGKRMSSLVLCPRSRLFSP